jgi:predicted dehydrogenase/threonine dehydrogenase-like Zn-dependent dehydrogenase
MKQLILDLKNGRTELMDVPVPMVADGHLLIRTTVSLVSPGTERMLVDFGKAGWMKKARQQPERVQQVLNKIRTDGLKPTLLAIKGKLGQPIPLGYSQCGIVIGVGTGVKGYAVGDRVASNGYHAEVVSVPQNLVAKVPDNVPDEAAAFTVMASIALQSIRLAAPTFGETVAVIGLGLLGQLTAQLLRAAGCRVIGFDIKEDRVNLLREQGMLAINSSDTDAVSFALEQTNQVGVDAVLLTAASKSNDLISAAAQMSRKRGRIVLSGVTDLSIQRSDFFEKELTFQVSCSYGPGRYDAAYEQRGQDYPIGFVRWTEQRNFEAVLQALAGGQLNITPLITQQIPLTAFETIYNQLDGSVMAALLQYDIAKDQPAAIHCPPKGTATGGIGIIGAGSFTSGVLLPQLKKAGASIKAIAAKGGLSATVLAQKFNIGTIATDYTLLLNDGTLNAVFITTRHRMHAAMVAASLRAGKHVFVEKPLAIDEAGLEDIIASYNASGCRVYVGFNRRYAPFTAKMKALLQDASGPMNIVMTINAGRLPEKHWLNDPAEGGRIIGEACHFIDLAGHLAGSTVTCVTATTSPQESALILLQLANGSTAAIHYLTNGSAAYDKERIEVFSDGRTLILENWRTLTGYGFQGFSKQKATQDKGHQAQFRAVVAAMKTADALIPFESLINTTRASFAAVESTRSRTWISLT